MLGVVSICSISGISEVWAQRKCSDSSAGRYCKEPGQTHPKCPEGCYCSGYNKYAVNDTTISDYKKVDDRCKDHSSAAEEHLGKSSIYYCPSSYPDSPKGSTRIEDCFFKSEEGVIVYFNSSYRVDVPAGKYLKAGHTTPDNCPADKYCPGGSLQAFKDINNGINNCPASGVVSDNGKKCTITCKAGTYLYMLNSRREYKVECADCPDGKICKGYTYEFKKAPEGTTSLGVDTCSDDKVPNETHTECVTPQRKVHCGRGFYLPKKSETCYECPDGFYCPYDKDFPVSTIDQGNERCDDNQIPNEKKTGCITCPNGQKADKNKTQCVEIGIEVNKGWYLPANSTTSKQCTESKKFCPGGEYLKKSVDQGKYDCPFNSSTNSDNSACNLILTTDQLKNGISGNGKCWMKTDPEDFVMCIYGTRLKQPSLRTSQTNTTPQQENPRSDFGEKEDICPEGCEYKMGGCKCPFEGLKIKPINSDLKSLFKK